MKLLEVGQSSPFTSRIEGKDVLLRIGVEQNENSFINACLCAYEPQFEKMSDAIKTKLIERVKASVIPVIHRRKWEQVYSETRYKVAFKETLLKEFETFYNSYKNDIKLSKNDIEYFDVILQIIKLSDIKTFVASLENNDNSLPIYIKASRIKFINHCKTILSKIKIDEQKLLKCLNKMESVYSDRISNIQENMFESFRSKQSNTIELTDKYLAEVSNAINRDIYILNAKDNENRLPIQGGEMKRRKSLILICHGAGKYEPVGKLMNNEIIFDLYHQDPLIKRIYTFVYEPEKIADLYPNLLKYLPDKYRKVEQKFTKRCSRSPTRHRLMNNIFNERESSSQEEEDN